ncbi:MAG: DUF799 family lipoprotein [Bacteroidales bacterium]|nr:DUF799 family lipoprotein [Bacteroidales bacterium]
MKARWIIAVAALAVLLTSCEATRTRQSLYPKMYEEKPVALLVMPPINNTTNVEAKELLYTSVSYPLIEAGYYVVSPHLAMELLKAESAYDAEMFIDQDAAIFGRVFGVDAVIFSVIDTWKKEGFGIRTDLHYIVKSTTTNEVLFDRRCNLYLDLQQKSSGGGGLAALTDLVSSALATALTDHIVAARKCNAYIFSDIPRGKYHPAYGQDMAVGANERDIKATVK